MKICFIGASHLPAMESAWPAMRDQGAERSVAAGFLFSTFEELVIADGVLGGSPQRRKVMHAAGRLAEVSLAEWDAFVIVGAFKFKDALEVYDGYRGESYTSVSAARGVVPQLVSDACFELAMLGKMRAFRAYRFAQALRPATVAPILLLPAPLFRAGVLDYPRHRPRFAPLREGQDEIRLVAAWRRAMDILAGTSFDVIQQAPETLESPALTRDVYSIGTAMPRAGTGRTAPIYDTTHMTTAYGAIMMQRCLEWARSSMLVG